MSAIDAAVAGGDHRLGRLGRDDDDDDRQPRRRPLRDRERRRRRRATAGPPPSSRRRTATSTRSRSSRSAPSSVSPARRSSTTATRSRSSATSDPDSRHVHARRQRAQLRADRDPRRPSRPSPTFARALPRCVAARIACSSRTTNPSRLPGSSPGPTPRWPCFSGTPRTISAPLPGIAAGTWVDALSGQAQSLSPELTNVAGAPLSLQLLFPEGSSCATSAQ